MVSLAGRVRQWEDGSMNKGVRRDMLLLWDKGFDAHAFLSALADTGA